MYGYTKIKSQREINKWKERNQGKEKGREERNENECGFPLC